MQESTTYFFISRNFCIVLAFAGLSTITNIYPGGVDSLDFQLENGVLTGSLLGPPERLFTLAGNACVTAGIDFFICTFTLENPDVTNALPTPMPFINEYIGLP
jgi:hypothetical protein